MLAPITPRPRSRQRPAPPTATTLSSHSQLDGADCELGALLEFADVLAAAAGADLADTIAAYRQLCDRVLLQLARPMALDAAGGDVAVWTTERDTWALVEALLRVRLNGGGVVRGDDSAEMECDTGDVIEPGRTDRGIVADLHTNDPQLSEYVAVKDWLEQIVAPMDDLAVDGDPEHFDTHRNPYACTMRSLEAYDGRSMSAVVSLDPDAAVRASKGAAQPPLHADDLAHENEMLRRAFLLIRRGRMDKALDLYRACHQHWRVVSLTGGTFFFKEQGGDADGEGGEAVCGGNRNRGLWRMACFQLSNDSAVNVYERAQYAVLSGNATNILPVCKTYEDHLWAYFTALVFNVTEKKLKADFPRILGDDFHDFEVPDIDVLEPRQIINVVKPLLSPASRATSGGGDQQKITLLRLVQNALIVDDWSDLLPQLCHDAARIDINLHRFVVHVLLLLRDAQLLRDECDCAALDSICAAFVDQLIVRDLRPQVPVYVCQLPFKAQIDKFSGFISGLAVDVAERQTILRRAQSFGLNVGAIVVEAMRAEYTGTADLYADECCMNDWTSNLRTGFRGVKSASVSLLPADSSLNSALLWLMMERNQGLDALLYCNAVYRRYWLSGKFGAAKSLRHSLQQDAPYFASEPFLEQLKLRHRDDVRAVNMCAREQVHHNLFLDALDVYDQWLSLWNHQPRPTESTSWIKWTAQIRQSTAAIHETLLGLLGTSDSLSWLRDDDDDDAAPLSRTLQEHRALAGRMSEIARIRKAYIPELAQLLQEILRNTKDVLPANLSASIDLAWHIAEPERGLYREFIGAGAENDSDVNTQHLKDFLAAVVESVVDTLDASGSTF